MLLLLCSISVAVEEIDAAVLSQSFGVSALNRSGEDGVEGSGESPPKRVCARDNNAGDAASSSRGRLLGVRSINGC